jgi:integrase
LVHLWFKVDLGRAFAVAGMVTHARLETATARRRLARGRQPHWQALAQGKHIGWQRWPDDPCGRWVLRQHLGGGQYRQIEIGKADDEATADGEFFLDFEQAQAKARAALAAPNRGRVSRLTVQGAFELYVEHQRARNKSLGNVLSRGRVHILPALGHRLVEDLTAAELRQWLATMAAQPPQARPGKNGTLKFRAKPKSDDEKRKRLASANRTLAVLKALLNFVYDEGHTGNRDAWGRKLKPFENADAPRIRFLDIEECTRLLNAAEPNFRLLCRAALETGLRYQECARLQCRDFNSKAGTITVTRSKSGKIRHVILTDDGVSFFKSVCIGRDGSALMFTKPNGQAWKESDQKKPMRRACAAARLSKASFHTLRHTYASLCVMAGVPLAVVAQNLGHRDGQMTEKHYAHLSPSFARDAIKAGAPRFGQVTATKVVPLK